MVVVRRLDQFDALAGSLDGGGEIARLTLEFWRLVGAVGYNDRKRNLSSWRCGLIACSISSVNRTKELRLDRRTALRSYMPLEQMPPFTISVGTPVIPLPVGYERDGRQMRAGGAAADVEPVRISTEGGCVLVCPSNGASHLGGY